MMKKEHIGEAVLYIPEYTPDRPEDGVDEQTRQLKEIVSQFPETEYHGQITGRKSWGAMYQLAEPRSNIIEWIYGAADTKALELGAGCGTITSMLLKKCGEVVCQEENIHYCKLNAKRHENCKLTIYAMPFEQCEPLIGNDYDWIVLVDVLARAEADKLLRQLAGHLKPQGMLIIASENKFGLKYWAGNKEANTLEYFAGLENRAQKQGVNLYTRRGLEELLAKAGFAKTRFYYPYPDHRFMRDLYCDQYLPQTGDLSYNITNYEDDRIVLFDEQKVFDNIIAENLFPLFTNSYLCLARRHATETGAEKMIYVRYAGDRDRAYALRTEVCLVDGQKIVRKKALYPQGEAHIRRIPESYERLCGQYGHTGLKFNSCRLQEQGADVWAEFSYITGGALQAQVRQLIADGELKKVFDILRQMVQYIRNGKNNREFELTEEFTDVFGSDATEVFQAGAFASKEERGRLTCSEVSDIDLILPNILVDAEGAWHVIDYEWTFFFPVPCNYMIYRTLFFLHQENSGIAELAMDRLLAFAGITPQEAELYERMESGFQRFVAGGLVPYREMVNLLGRKYWNVVQMEEAYRQAAAQNELLKGKGIWKIARKIKRAVLPGED